MTDHNAEGGKMVELLPCPFCDGEKIHCYAWEDECHVTCGGCLASIRRRDKATTIFAWNNRIDYAAQRRKDFNAGVAFANHQEMGRGEPTFALLDAEKHPPSYMNADGDDVDAFDMYLAKDRK